MYWRPVYNLLESSVELFLVNAQHVKMVPGRKTDVRDSEWLPLSTRAWRRTRFAKRVRPLRRLPALSWLPGCPGRRVQT